MHLSEVFVANLRSFGLDITSDPTFGPSHMAFPDGYVVLKPARVPGNSIPGYEAWYTSYQGVDESTDAPSVFIYFHEDKWFYEVAEYAPGPGPGDFRRFAQSESELQEKIRVYFFEPNDDFEAATRARDDC